MLRLLTRNFSTFSKVYRNALDKHLIKLNNWVLNLQNADLGK